MPGEARTEQLARETAHSDPPAEDVANTDQNKRAALKGVLLALAGAGLLALPGKAMAQDIGGGDIDDLIDDIDDIRQLTEQLVEVLLRAFAEVANVPVPGFVREILAFLESLLGRAGDDSFSGEDPGGAIERSFPSDPAVVETPNLRRAFGELRVGALVARADEAFLQAVNASAAQQGISEEEAAIVAAAPAGNVIGLLAANNALVASLSSRVGTLSAQLQALVTLIGDQQLERVNAIRLQRFANDQIIGAGAGEELAPIERFQAQ